MMKYHPCVVLMLLFVINKQEHYIKYLHALNQLNYLVGFERFEISGVRCHFLWRTSL